MPVTLNPGWSRDSRLIWLKSALGSSCLTLIQHCFGVLCVAASALAAATTVHAASPEAGPAVRDAFDVKAFGAAGDGKTIDTPAIDKAIEAAAAAGGGSVRFPAGNYLCYSIHLRSHITLCLDAGATIVAAETPASGGGYDPPEPNAWDKFQDFGHSHWHNSLIWGEDLQNVSIEGQGLIWGKGLSRGDRDAVLPAGVGNKSISLKNCRNYPDPNRFGPLPAQGFYIRHVKGIEIRDVEVRALKQSGAAIPWPSRPTCRTRSV